MKFFLKNSILLFFCFYIEETNLYTFLCIMYNVYFNLIQFFKKIYHYIDIFVNICYTIYIINLIRRRNKNENS